MKQGWTYKRLGEVATIIGGSTPKTSIEEYWGGTHYWVTPANLDGNKYQGATPRTITDLAVKETNLQLLPTGTVLLSSRAPIGKVAITTVPMYCNQGFKNIVCSNLLINEFVYWYLFGKVDYLNSLGKGATFKEISKKTTEQIPIPVPSLEEQQHIVDYLNAAFAQIDELKSNAERQLAEGRALFQSALTQAMQPKPGWQEKTLGEIANIIHGKNQKEVISETGKYPIYGSGGNIMGYATDYLCEAGTTILGRKGSINNPQFINEKFWNVDTAFGISAKEDNDNKFIYYFIKSVDWAKKNTGTTLPSLTQSVVKSVSLFVPNLTDQQAISSNLDSLHAQISEIERVNKRIAAECDALKQALLRQIFE